MATLYYYQKHHELQSEMQQKANKERIGSIVDLRRSWTQQIFFRAFYGMFIQGYELTSKKINGETIGLDFINNTYIEKIFTDRIWPETKETKDFENPLYYFRTMGYNMFKAGIECTSNDWNSETDPCDLIEDTRENPSILHDKYETAIMWAINIFDKEELQNEKYNDSRAD